MIKLLKPQYKQFLQNSIKQQRWNMSQGSLFWGLLLIPLFFCAVPFIFLFCKMCFIMGPTSQKSAESELIFKTKKIPSLESTNI